MILIADAGGTKCDWRLLDGSEIQQFASPGFNPLTHELNEFLPEVKALFEPVAKAITKVYYYGASMYPDNEPFRNDLLQIFPNAQIFLNNDLFGSCRSLSGTEPAFIGILGTGSAGCFYDGEKVAIHPPSMGHSLGDEGSGAMLGKRFISQALRNRFDADMQGLFKSTFGLTKDDVYAEVYLGEKPNAYLASFATFVSDHRSHPQIMELIVKEFKNFFEAYFTPMPDTNKYQFHFSGSIAFHFSDILRSVGTDYGFSIGKIVKGPAAGLALYHQQYG